MSIRTIVALCALLLGGCVSVPPASTLSLKPGDKIGIYVALDETPTHSHFGTTVFNNFKKAYPYQWPFNAEVKKILTEVLREQYQVEVYDFAAFQLGLEEVNNLVITERNRFVVNPEKEVIYKQLLADGFKSVIIISGEQDHLALLECGAYGCTERVAQGMGLVTRSFLGIDRYYATPAAKISVYYLETPAILSDAGPVERATGLSNRTSSLSQIRPANFNNLNQEDWSIVRSGIEEKLSQYIQAIGETFRDMSH